jgi:hypothetical protein
MKRSTAVLLAALVLLAAAAYFVLQKPGESSVQSTEGEPLVSYDSSSVDRLEVSSAGTTITLSQEAGKWMIISPVRFPADDAGVKSAISRGRKIELKGLVSSNPEKQQVFQVDSAGTLVKIFERGGEKAAFRIGKAGTTFSETYVRRERSNDVYVAEGPLSYIFVKSPKDWRDRAIFKTEREKISSIQYTFRDTIFTLAFRDSLWMVDNEPASQPAVQSLLGSISNFLTNEFVDSVYIPSGPPIATIQILGTQIRFYQPKGNTRFLVQTSSSPQWYEVESWRAAEVLKRKKDLHTP